MALAELSFDQRKRFQHKGKAERPTTMVVSALLKLVLLI